VRYSYKGIEVMVEVYTLKEIGSLPNLYPEEEPSRFRMGFPNLKRFSE